ncbi:formate dehydrogenase accessory sulfurtransferase FdhD [Sphingomonas ginsenosidivorax]|uniref:Sulfur carrier protein FdhD n=1 Tax=Sphingomonas ginsenosidivorax TaxID=862135 RepID=A0A5C6UDV2_9SPHN|nr:formate dehydrogenase accessory sulfurtransferase FdhD [Sphingomonas ginsenosidivorax]TXC70849.1 formate dehydrogenase accessory sulfurtransferase FdhD [Sphingomonas ginsenosidivorax]
MTSSRTEPVLVLRPHGVTTAERRIAIEAPVAIEVDGLGYAVMMMTPADLDAFATGFLLTERLADAPADIVDIDVFEGDIGWIVRVTLADRCRGRIHDRVRHRTSDTSCGLCGISGLEQLRRPVAARPPAPSVEPAALFAALAGLRAHQPLNAATGAIHAAAACGEAGAVVAAFEDVGRHNALDKLVGGLAVAGTDCAFILVTSRISFEMVDKALVAGVPMLVGISAPTSLAIDHAREHGLTLLALARSDAILVVNDPWSRFAAQPAS